MKALHIGFLALIASLFLIGCSSSSNNGAAPDAQIRFVHVSPFTGPVMVAVDGKTVLPSLDYRTATPFVSIGPGLHTVTYTPVNGGPVAATLPISVYSTGQYSYYFYGGPGATTSLGTIDGTADAASNYFKVRVINLATGLGAVDVYVLAAGTTIDSATAGITGIPYGGSSTYVAANIGTYTLAVTPAGSKQILYTTGALPYPSNAKVTLTVFSAGSEILANGVMLTTGGAAVFVDNPQAEPRFVSAIPVVAAADMLIDGATFVSNVAYGTASGYLPTASGAHNVKIQPTDTPGGYVYDQSQALVPGADMSLVGYALAGTGSVGLLALVDNNLPPLTGKAKLRIVNASSDATAYDVYLNTSTIASALAQGTASAYQQLDPVTATITVEPAGTSTIAATIPIALANPHVYTVYIMGNAGSVRLLATTDR